MMWQPETFYIILLIVFALVSAGISVYSFHRRHIPTATSFALMMLGIAFWLWGYAFELKSTELTGMLFWVKVGYLGVSTVPALWLVFSLQYAGKDRWLTRRNLLLLFLIPLVVLLSNWTNALHMQYYTTVGVDTSGPFPRLHHERGILYWIGVIYAYLTLLMSTVILVQMFARSARPYRGQIGVILIAASVPWVANFLYLTGLNPFPFLNLTPLGFWVTGLVMTWGLFRHKLLDIVPVARDKVVENMRDGVIVLDAQARIVDINLAAQAQVNASAADAIGQPLAQVLPERVEAKLHYDAVTEFHTQIILGDAQHPRDYELSVSPLYDQPGKLTGWIMLLHDVTERKQTEEALRQQALELESRNAELDAFSHTVAHDLKNPLSILIGYSQLLESRFDGMTKTTIIENLRRLSRTGFKMTSIIDELLLLASVRKVEDVKIEPLDTEAIVAEVRVRLDNEITKYQAEMRLPETWPTALGHRAWVEEVWMNYISNALKYGGNPEKDIPPHIEIGWHTENRASEETESNQPPFSSDTLPHICFWVRDNGPGLTAEQKAQLFTQFTRLHQVRATGHGLGLSIVQRITEKLSGEVGVESELGQGSTFHFTLPAFPQSNDRQNEAI